SRFLESSKTNMQRGPTMKRFGLQITCVSLLLTMSVAVMAQGSTGAAHSTPPQSKQQQPTSAVQNIYSEKHTYFGDKLTIVPRLEYSHTDRNQLNLSGFLVLDAIFLGRIDVDDIEYDTLKASLGFRYDLTDRIQLQATVPYLFRRASFKSIGKGGSTASVAEQTVKDNGLGDVTGRVYYHAVREQDGWPDIVFNVG